MELTENFDQHKLNYILQNQNTFREKMRESCFDDNYNPFAILTKYLIKSRNGTITTTYHQNNNRGRFYANGSLSLQSVPREIRHTIATNYIDIDMVNAHPVILLHLCKAKGFTPKILSRYCKNRDTLLPKLKVSKEAAKTCILSIWKEGIFY